MTIHDEVTFEHCSLETITELNKYSRILAYLPQNPFYKIELLLLNKYEIDYKLSYFILRYNALPAVLMPIVQRKVEWQGNIYWHVFTPYGYSGPLYSKTIKKKILSSFWSYVDVWYLQNNVITEFVRFGLQNNYEEYTGLLMPSLSNVCGEIRNKDTQWFNFKSKVRNNYRKSINQGLRCEIFHKSISKERIYEFYSVYSQTMKRVNADNKYFFSVEKIEHLIINNANSTALAIVYKEDKAISVELLLLSSYEITSFLGGTLSDFFDLRPNDFLKIEVINWARLNGYKYYVLGGGKSINDSLHKYKKSFFPKDNEKVFYTGRKIINRKVYVEICNSSKIDPNTVNNSKIPFPAYLHGYG